MLIILSRGITNATMAELDTLVKNSRGWHNYVWPSDAIDRTMQANDSFNVQRRRRSTFVCRDYAREISLWWTIDDDTFAFYPTGYLFYRIHGSRKCIVLTN